MFIRVLIDNYAVLIIANIVKLGLFPFTHLIIIFYIKLTPPVFIILNICKLPYLSMISIKLNALVIIPTIAYSIYWIYQCSSTMLILTVYRVTSRVIILTMQKQSLNVYYLISLLSMYLCLIGEFDIVRIYNLMRLPMRLTFYIKIQFLLTLRLLNIVWIITLLTLLMLYMVKYISRNNKISKWMLILVLINSTIL